jgi:hypothetical protein
MLVSAVVSETAWDWGWDDFLRDPAQSSPAEPIPRLLGPRVGKAL